MPGHVAGDTFVAPYNSLEAVERIVAERGAEVAAILVEPVAGNMGLVEPRPEFLPGLRKLADTCGALLIFDEVISGFRFNFSTYGAIVGVTPDLITLGKVIGGGLPLLRRATGQRCRGCALRPTVDLSGGNAFR